MADKTIVLQWKCDGGCGKVLVEGRDRFCVLKVIGWDDSGKGQKLRLCEECTKTQLSRPADEEIKNGV